jgi:hypothetical protein
MDEIQLARIEGASKKTKQTSSIPDICRVVKHSLYIIKSLYFSEYFQYGELGFPDLIEPVGREAVALVSVPSIPVRPQPACPLEGGGRQGGRGGKTGRPRMEDTGRKIGQGRGEGRETGR